MGLNAAARAKFSSSFCNFIALEADFLLSSIDASIKNQYDSHMHNVLPSVFRYKKNYLVHDLTAAVAVAAVTVPSALALASIIGVPPAMGLYAALLAPIVFGLLAHTRRLVIGPDSATAALIASGAVLVTTSGLSEYVNAVLALSFVVGIMLLIFGILRFGFLADLISRPVMLGFLGGVGVQLIMSQLPSLFGTSASGGTWNSLSAAISQFPQLNSMTLTVSILVIGVVFTLKNTRIPGELVGLVLAAIFSLIFGVRDFGVTFIGDLPQGLPSFALPNINLEMLTILLPTALSIAVVVLAQSSTLIRNLASEHDDDVALNRDLSALGIASIAASFFHGFLVNGTPSRTQVADNAGMRTQLVNIFSGMLIGALLLWGGALFHYVPQAALAAIVCSLGVQLIRFRELRSLWSVRYEEFLVAMIALVCTVLFGVQLGVLIAVIVSLMERLRRQYRPRDAILLRDGKLSQWAVERFGDNKKLPNDILVYGFDDSIFFENVNYFVSRLKRAIRQAKHTVRYVVIDAGAIDDIDYTAIETLKRLYREFSEDGTAIAFAHVSPGLRAQFDIYGMTDIIGGRNIFPTLTKALNHPMSPSAHDMIYELDIAKNNYIVVGGAVLDLLHLRDTHDVDLVVSPEVYEQFRDKKKWREFVWTSGKKVLTHEQYTIMKTWMGHSLKQLQRDSQTIENVPCVSTERLIDAKKRIGRRKDLTDIALLTAHAKRRSR